MEIRNSFEVPLPPDSAWRVLMDIPRIVQCVPGAELTEKVDERTFKGRVSVKLGPIGLLFNGTAKFEQVNDVAHTALVKAQGADAKGRGGANSTVNFSLLPSEVGSRVEMVTDVALSGSVAQYGRGTGLIQGVATQLVNEFATALRAMLAEEQASGAPARSHSAAGDQADDTAGAASTSQAPMTRPISGFSLLLRAIWNSLSGLFGRR